MEMEQIFDNILIPRPNGSDNLDKVAHYISEYLANAGALVSEHGSQCGFCTPGFAMSLFGVYKNADSVASTLASVGARPWMPVKASLKAYNGLVPMSP